MENNSESSKENILGLLFGIYMAISQIMAVYFWWQYSREDSFLATITIDVLLAELKGILWVFFVW